MANMELERDEAQKREHKVKQHTVISIVLSDTLKLFSPRLRFPVLYKLMWTDLKTFFDYFYAPFAFLLLLAVLTVIASY